MMIGVVLVMPVLMVMSMIVVMSVIVMSVMNGRHLRIRDPVATLESSLEPALRINMRDGLRIGALAERAQCQAETIRYYEREGLLPIPPRSQGNYRLYGPAHIERLSFIRHCRSLDMTLDEIRTLLNFCDAPMSNCAQVSSVLDQHIHHVADRISQLRHLERQLKELRNQCASPGHAAGCGILKEMSRAAKRGQRALAPGHVHGSHTR
jgi:Cd(II)/Pb(II)-responsive transcriptional regulator